MHKLKKCTNLCFFSNLDILAMYEAAYRLTKYFDRRVSMYAVHCWVIFHFHRCGHLVAR